MALPDYLRKRKGFLELKTNNKWISWNPYHSKLSAYVLADGSEWPFEKKSTILYLGAAEGNTVSFLSHICHEGRIIGVDISSMAIMSNDFESYPDDNYENMKKFSERNNFNFPYVIDETQLVAKDFMALCTPDFFGFDSELKLQYRGRLNDSGKNQTNSNTKRELVNAMLSISNTGISSESQFASIGCSIKWR